MISLSKVKCTRSGADWLPGRPRLPCKKADLLTWHKNCHLSIQPFTQPSFHSSSYLPLFFFPSFHSSIHLSNHQFIHPASIISSLLISFHPSIHPFYPTILIYPFSLPFFHISIFLLSIKTSVYPSIHPLFLRLFIQYLSFFPPSSFLQYIHPSTFSFFLLPFIHLSSHSFFSPSVCPPIFSANQYTHRLHIYEHLLELDTAYI